MSKGLKVVFAGIMQHCIQSNVTHLAHVKRVKSVLCIKWPLAPQKYAVRVRDIFPHNFLNPYHAVCNYSAFTCFLQN